MDSPANENEQRVERRNPARPSRAVDRSGIVWDPPRKKLSVSTLAPRRLTGRLAGAETEPRRSSTRRRYGSSLEFAILASIEVLIALYSLAFAAFPPVPGSPRPMDLALGIGFLVLAALTWLVAPTLGDWGLDVSLAIAAVLIAAVVTIRPFDVGQVLAGMAIMLLVTFAAYSRPPSRLWPLVAWLLALYAAALAVSPRLPSPLFFVVAAAIVVAIAVLVSSLVERLRRQAMHDPLTRALNRRGIAEQAGLVAAVTWRSAKPMTVGLIDLDRFKKYNDVYGHQAGDDLLADLTRSWQGVLREGDLLGRVGGDEVAVVLPGTTIAQAEELATRMRAAHDIAWTVGFARWAPDEQFWTAMAGADEVLYQRKDARPGGGSGVIRAREAVQAGEERLRSTDVAWAETTEQLRAVLDNTPAIITRWVSIGD